MLSPHFIRESPNLTRGCQNAYPKFGFNVVKICKTHSILFQRGTRTIYVS